MFYTVYKITNTVNGKVYIGKHQTKDLNDNYMGSGKLLKHAIEKYGIDNFTKEILHVFDSEDEMNKKEAELVNESFVNSEKSYNLCYGGHGGWGYINNNGLNNPETQRLAAAKIIRNYSHLGGKASQKTLKDQCKGIYNSEIQGKGFLGKSHTKETRQLIGKKNSIKQSGTRNSQYGTMWITNGSDNRKIKKEDSIPEGWYNGRS